MSWNLLGSPSWLQLHRNPPASTTLFVLRVKVFSTRPWLRFFTWLFFCFADLWVFCGWNVYSYLSDVSVTHDSNLPFVYSLSILILSLAWFSSSMFLTLLSVLCFLLLTSMYCFQKTWWRAGGITQVRGIICTLQISRDSPRLRNHWQWPIWLRCLLSLQCLAS